MELRKYLKGKNRAEFAEKIGTTLNYLNNLCQHPEQAGKKVTLKIKKATNDKVTFGDMFFPPK